MSHNISLIPDNQQPFEIENTPSPSTSRPNLSHMNTTPTLSPFVPKVEDNSSINSKPSEQRPNGQEISKSDDSSSGDEITGDYLLQLFQNRQSEQYRSIRYKIPNHLNHMSSTKANYEKRVSFDTINIQYSDDVDYDFDDDDDDDIYNRSRKRNSTFDDYDFYGKNDTGRGRSPSPHPMGRSPAASPNPSPNRRTLSPMRGGNTNMNMSKLLSSFRVDYPTRPIITHRGCTFTKLHRKFEDLYLKQLYNEENGWLKPVLPHRVILVYISGRKHTWVALDWILRNFIEHGDSIIIVSAINHKFKSKRRYSSNYQSPQRVTAKTPKMRMRQRSRPEYIKIIAKNIMTYVMEVINKDVIAKVSIELAEGKSRDVLQEMYKLYEPNLVSTGTKPNLRISAPLKSWNSSKLTDRLVKNFPLPLIVVPAMNMATFEENLKDEIDAKYENEVSNTSLSVNSASAANTDNLSGDYSSSRFTPSSSQEYSNNPMKDEQSTQLSNSRRFSASSLIPAQYDGKPTISIDREDDAKDSDSSSINSDSSVDSSSSSNSYSSFDEITKLYKEYKTGMNRDLDKGYDATLDANYFSNIIISISERSSNFCQELRGIDPDFRGKGAKLARAITGSNSFGRVPYKTKSLLPPIEKAKTANEHSFSTPNSEVPSMSYKEMKRNLKLNAMKSHQQIQTPEINIQEPTENKSSVTDEGPRKSSLKFVDLQSPNSNNLTKYKTQGDTTSSKSSDKKKSSRFSKSLKKSLSHDIDLSTTRPNLEPSKSHPDITTALDSNNYESDKKGKKKKRFWKLFS